jgi:hypothetical protein
MVTAELTNQIHDLRRIEQTHDSSLMLVPSGPGKGPAPRPSRTVATPGSDKPPSLRKSQLRSGTMA